MLPIEPLTTAEALLGGLIGGGSVVASQFIHAEGKQEWPWKPGGWWRFLVASAARLVLGVGMAIVFTDTNQVSGIGGAVAIGISAPLIVDKLLNQTGLAKSGAAALAKELHASGIRVDMSRLF